MQQEAVEAVIAGLKRAGVSVVCYLPDSLFKPLYPAIALSRDFGLEHAEVPAVRRWLHDVRRLAPRVSMPGVLDPI